MSELPINGPGPEATQIPASRLNSIDPRFSDIPDMTDEHKLGLNDDAADNSATAADTSDSTAEMPALMLPDAGNIPAEAAPNEAAPAKSEASTPSVAPGGLESLDAAPIEARRFNMRHQLARYALKRANVLAEPIIPNVSDSPLASSSFAEHRANRRNLRHEKAANRWNKRANTLLEGRLDLRKSLSANLEASFTEGDVPAAPERPESPVWAEARREIEASRAAKKAGHAAEATEIPAAREVKATKEAKETKESGERKAKSTEKLHNSSDFADAVIDKFNEHMSGEKAESILRTRLADVRREAKEISRLSEEERSKPAVAAREQELIGQARAAELQLESELLARSFSETHGVTHDFKKAARLQRQLPVQNARVETLKNMDLSDPNYNPMSTAYELAHEEQRLAHLQRELNGVDPKLAAMAGEYGDIEAQESRIMAEYKEESEGLDHASFEYKEAARRANAELKGMYDQKGAIEKAYLLNTLTDRCENLTAQAVAMRTLLETADPSIRPMHEKLADEYETRLEKMFMLREVLEGSRPMSTDKAKSLLKRALSDPVVKMAAKPAPRRAPAPKRRAA